MNFYAFFPLSYEDSAILSAVPSDGPGSHRYMKAKPLQKDFPSQEDAVMCFDPNYPEKTKLYDIVDCLDSVLVVNSKVKEVFESQGVAGEFLPVLLWDHQDKPVSDDYYIFNCLEKVDFIDMEKSDVVPDAFFPDRVKNIDHLVVSKSIGSTPNAFVPSNMTEQVFITEDLKAALEAAEVKGFKVFNADGWDGLEI